MTKPKLTAALQEVSVVGAVLTIATVGTRARPGRSLIAWKLVWGDGTEATGQGAPAPTYEHLYLASGIYQIQLAVVESRGGAIAVASLTSSITVLPPTPIPEPPAPGPAPSAPTNLVATAGDAQVVLSWNLVGGATAYRVKRSISSGGPYGLIASPTTPSYVNTGLQNGTPYYYVVAAVAGTTEGPPSNQATATPTPALPAPPATPTNVQATAGVGQITITWNASATATSYRVQRSLSSGGGYSTIATPSGTSHVDTTVVPGTVYFYRVSAINAGGESVPSSPVSAAAPTAPGIPTGIIATPGNGQITIEWTTVPGATSYRVKRSLVSGGPYTLVGSPTVTNFVNTGLTNLTPYYYIVTAVNAVGESGPSAQVSAVPNAQTGQAYYVALNGSNSNNGSLGAPWATLPFAMQQVSAGDSIVMRGGIYLQNVYVDPSFGQIATIPSGTSWANKITVTHWPGETVWLAPQTSPYGVLTLRGDISYWEFDGINIDASAPGIDNEVAVNFTFGDNPNPAGPFPDPHHIRFKNAEVVGRQIQGEAQWLLQAGNHPNNAPFIGGFEWINVHAHHCSAYGIYLATANSLVERCEFNDCAASAIHIYKNGAPAHHNIIRFNYIHDIHLPQTFFSPNDYRFFIILVAGDANQIYNNIIWNCSYSGVGFDPNIQAVLVTYRGDGNIWSHNTVVGCSTMYLGTTNGSESPNTRYQNNVSRGNFSETIRNGGDGTNPAILDHNHFGGANPLFVNEAGGNFHLQSGSPLRGAGAILSAPPNPFGGFTYSVDYDLVPRGSPPDIGAFQFV